MALKGREEKWTGEGRRGKLVSQAQKEKGGEASW
jgi:hypothetical protein